MDEFDFRILAALQRDGRLTNAELADRVGLSASQCSRRRSQLEADGVIASYHAALDAEKLGIDVVAFIHVTLATHSPDNARRFADLVNDIDEVMDAYSLTGESDYLIKLAVPTLKVLSQIVSDTLLPHPSVAHVRSSIVLNRLKESRLLPLRRPRPGRDM